jgi:AraC-like DNA-binding protein
LALTIQSRKREARSLRKLLSSWDGRLTAISRLKLGTLGARSRPHSPLRGGIDRAHAGRAARLRAIKSDIEAHLTYSDLSPGVVARRQGVSDSYIRKLFEGEGTSFSQFVLGRRLVRAQRMLTDLRWADRSIAWIAFETGFGDLSYFNRTFKRFYGNTPSEVRGAVVVGS